MSFILCPFVITLMTCLRNLTLVYNNQPMVKLVSLHVVLLEVVEPIDDIVGTYRTSIIDLSCELVLICLSVCMLSPPQTVRFSWHDQNLSHHLASPLIPTYCLSTAIMRLPFIDCLPLPFTGLHTQLISLNKSCLLSSFYTIRNLCFLPPPLMVLQFLNNTLLNQ